MTKASIFNVSFHSTTRFRESNLTPSQKAVTGFDELALHFEMLHWLD